MRHKIPSDHGSEAAGGPRGLWALQQALEAWLPGPGEDRRDSSQDTFGLYVSALAWNTWRPPRITRTVSKPGIRPLGGGVKPQLGTCDFASTPTSDRANGSEETALGETIRPMLTEGFEPAGCVL